MLNKEQQDAVYHIDGPCLVTACPGSGKTRVIVHRACHMIKSGIDPSSILMLTFTNKAAKEMKNRLSEMLGSEQSEKISCSTFHSLCVKILRKYYSLCGVHKNFNISDEDDCMVIAQSLVDSKKINLDSEEIKSFIRKINSSRENHDISMERIYEWFPGDSVLSSLILEYIDSIKKSGNIDFTGILHEVYMLLKSNEECKNFINNRFKYVMVDEVQDTNLLQFELLKLMASHNNLFMVGDLDQSIYKFRGARPENMIKFCEERSAKIIRLTSNYRCGPYIIKLANSIIEKNSNRMNEKIIGAKNNGHEVAKYIALTREEESEAVAKSIKNLYHSGTRLNEIAILFRTSYISRSFELSCSKFGIPYDLVGAFKFFEREEIRDTISMLKFLNNPNDTMSLFRFVNKPKKGIGPKMFGKFLENFKSSNQDRSGDFSGIYALVDSFSSYDNRTVVSECIDFVIKATSYEEYLKKAHKDTYEDRMDNIRELKNSCINFDNKPNANLNNWLLNLMLMDSQDSDDSNGFKVKLMSMHAAKGLEFDCVFVVGLEDGVCPHKRSIQEDPSNIEEERRLLYVATTRAKERLFLSMSAVTDLRTNNISMPSRFLIESGYINLEKYYEHVSGLVKKNQSY